MIHLFRRRELLTTYDQSRFNQVRDALAAKGIDYQYRIQDRTSHSPFSADRRNRFSTLEGNAAAQLEYQVYVRKDDWDQAKSLL
ncbi:MAG: hypothetical protein AAGU02_02075 [Lawsonibacter sp.]